MLFLPSIEFRIFEDERNLKCELLTRISKSLPSFMRSEGESSLNCLEITTAWTWSLQCDTRAFSGFQIAFCRQTNQIMISFHFHWDARCTHVRRNKRLFLWFLRQQNLVHFKWRKKHKRNQGWKLMLCRECVGSIHVLKLPLQCRDLKRLVDWTISLGILCCYLSRMAGIFEAFGECFNEDACN